MLDERTLISQLRKPSTREKAFAILVRQYQETLYWQIRRIVLSHEDADDTLQNTFIKVWTALDTFRGDAKLSTWLYRIAVNESLNTLERKRHAGELFDSATERTIQRLADDPYFDGDSLQLQLQEAISLLPDKQRAVFNLKYFQEMKYEEMSEVFGTSVGALKASYHHAVKKITDYFRQHD